ncbi:MAG: hypothetical protein JXL80_01465, partial [Planctomycetes bacterium]|nr:hypothetical protein [Planctomycetota bacterium]
MRGTWIAVVLAAGAVWMGCSPESPQAAAADPATQSQPAAAADETKNQPSNQEQKDVSEPDTKNLKR